MSHTIVLFKSKYGATKKYAEWLSEELSCDLLETRKAKIEQLKKYDTVILGGGIYASGISGLSFIKKNYETLKNKKLAVFAVGASPFTEEAFAELKNHNLKDEFSAIPCFYCRGAWNEDNMSWPDKTLCKMLKKAVAKKDPKDYQPWEKALMEAIGTNHDWTDIENLKPIIDFIIK